MQSEEHYSIDVNLVHAFGSTCSFNYNDAIAICDEETDEAKIMFPAGKAIARKHIDQQHMDFIPFDNNAEAIECIHFLPRRTHVATSEKLYGSNLRVIRLYSASGSEKPQTIKIFHDKDEYGVIKSIVFSSSEPHFMCCLIGEPHHKLIYIDVSRTKPLAESNFTVKDVDKITISPRNSHLICTSGSSFIRFFKVQEYAFKPFEDVKRLPKGRKFLNHAWYRSKVVLAVTDKCEVIVIEENKFGAYEVKQEYQNVFNQPNGDKILITAICPFSKGFILGSGNGKFCLWIRKEHGASYEEEKLELVRKWATTEERASNVTGIAISNKEDILAISLANNDIATIFLNDLMPQATDLDAHSQTNKEILFEYLYKGFHNKPITGMDVCLQRPLVATCSHEDSTIRIWNYKNFACKLLRMFYFRVKDTNQSDADNKPLLTLAFHPTGYYLAVGCTDKLRLFYVLSNQLRPYRELPIKNAHIVKFSNGGHKMACASPVRDSEEISSQEQIIHVFNAITLEEINAFSVHQKRIQSLLWKNYDENLCSIGEGGTLVEWRTSDWRETKRVHKPEYRFETCTYFHLRNEIVVFATAFRKNFIHRYWNEEPVSSSHSHALSPCKFEEIEIDMKVVIMREIVINKRGGILIGLENGSLLVVGLAKGIQTMNVKSEHLKTLTEICVSPCSRYVITTGRDCMLFVYQATLEVNGNLVEQDGNNVVDDFLADVVLYPKKEITRYEEKEKEYSKVLSSLERKLSYISEEAQKKHRQRVHELEMQKNRVIEDLKYRTERIKEQIETIRGKNKEALNDLDSKNLSEAEQLQQKYEEKIEFEKEKYFQLEQEIIQEKMIQQNRLKQLEQEKIRQMGLIKEEFKRKFQESEQIFTRSKAEVNKATEEFENQIKNVESEQEEELREMQERLQLFKTEKAASKEELEQRLKKAEDEYKRKLDEKEEGKKKNDELLFKKRKVEKEVEEAQEKLKELEVEFEEKVEILVNKEEKIGDFEKKVNDLQKKKHILSYKATEMKKALEPKEMQIDKLKSDLMKLKKEFESSVERKEKLVLYMERIEKERQFFEKEVANQEAEVQKNTNNLDQIIYDIYSCVEHNKNNPDMKVYQKELIKLYHKYVEKHEKRDDNHDPKGVEEMTKQIVHLEKSLFQMNQSNKKNINRKHEEISKRINENAELITNLNDVKKENQELDRKIKAKNMEIEKLTAQKNELLARASTPAKHFDDLSDFSIDNFKLGDHPKDTLLKSRKANLLEAYHNKERTQADHLAVLKRRECELVSELQFLAERSHKADFFIKEVQEHIRKHFSQYQCSGDPISLNNDSNT